MKLNLIHKPDTCSLDLLSMNAALLLSKQCEAREQFEFAAALVAAAEQKREDMLIGGRVQ